MTEEFDFIIEPRDKSDRSYVFSHCYHCDADLTQEEIEFYNENATMCCDGYMCGCMGLPTEPPYCFKCMEGE